MSLKSALHQLVNVTMSKLGAFLFRIQYFLYVNTRIGYYYNQRKIKIAKAKFGEHGHTKLTQFDYGDLTILPIPMMADNYAYLVSDTKNNKSVVIDPGCAADVQKVLAQRNIQPEAILATHKHWDHCAGNWELKKIYPGLPVYGGELDNVPEGTHTVTDGDKLEFGHLKFRIIFTPGHTVGHVVYVLEGAGFKTQDNLFCGDCLFLAGCGYLFEGTAATMLTSLDKLACLKDDTLLWPAHEIAVDNLEFASHIDPDNIILQKKQKWVKDRRENSLCTCPSSIGEEKSYNPFMRTSEETIMRAVGIHEPRELTRPSDKVRARVLELIREHKDNFVI